MNIDKFGAIIDGFLKENDIGIIIRFPEGSLEPEIEDNHGLGTVINLYMALHALKSILKELCEIDGPMKLDKDKVPDMIDDLMEIVKRNLKDEVE